MLKKKKIGEYVCEVQSTVLGVRVTLSSTLGCRKKGLRVIDNGLWCH